MSQLNEDQINQLIQELYPDFPGATIERLKQVSLDDFSLLYLGGHAKAHLVVWSNDTQIIIGSVLEGEDTFTFYPIIKTNDREELPEGTITFSKFEGWMDWILKIIKFGLVSRALIDAKAQAEQVFRDKGIDPETDQETRDFIQELVDSVGPGMNLKNLSARLDGKV